MKEFFPIDKKAPRFRKKIPSHLKAEVIEGFVKTHPQYENFDKTTAVNILKTLHKSAIELLRTHRDGIELPCGLGQMLILTYKSGRKKRRSDIDFVKSEALGKLVYYTNLNEDSRFMTIAFSNRHVKQKIADPHLWKFRLHRVNRIYLSNRFNENWQIYHQPASQRAVFTMTPVKKIKIKKASPIREIPKFYDEFDMN